MRKIKYIYYKASDNTVFDNKDECLKYENVCCNILTLLNNNHLDIAKKNDEFLSIILSYINPFSSLAKNIRFGIRENNYSYFDYDLKNCKYVFFSRTYEELISNNLDFYEQKKAIERQIETLEDIEIKKRWQESLEYYNKHGVEIC